MKNVKWISAALFVISLAVALGCRWIEWRDTDDTIPVIKMDSDTIVVPVDATDEDILRGVTATDDKDGDVSASLCVENISNFITDGERKVSILAFDSDNHVSRVERILQYSDYTDTRFTLSAPLRFSMGTTKLAANMKATDCLDGNISKWILFYNAENSTFNETVPGDYKVEFSVSNSAGAVTKFDATVEILDSSVSGPTITLSSYLAYVKKGESFAPVEYLKGVSVDGVAYEMSDGELLCSKDLQDEKDEIRSYELSYIAIDNEVNTAMSGWYEVTYALTDTEGVTGKYRMIVCVEE